MSARAAKVEAVIRAITRAFTGVARLDGVSLHEAQAIDAWDTEERRKRARAADTERHWEDVPAQDIANGYNVLPYLDAKGFRYYIPAYMRWTLQNLENSSSLTVDFTIYALVPSRSGKPEKYSLLSKPQAAAIAQFLGFIVEESEGHADDEAALEGFEYWATYETADS